MRGKLPTPGAPESPSPTTSTSTSTRRIRARGAGGTRRARWSRREPPPWWPEGEAWPPERTPWVSHRRGFLFRFFTVLGLFFVLVGVFGWLASALFHSAWNHSSNDGPPVIVRAIIGLTVILSITILIGHRIRRTVEPLADVMEAVERVANGDYQARVTGNGPREVSRLVATFNSMAERLGDNETQRQRLFADIAHEFRTPLSIIQGNIEGMLDGIYPRDDAHLAPLLDEARVITRLLNDLQTIAIAESGMLRLDIETIDFRDLLEDARAAFEPSAASRGIAITCTADAFEMKVDAFRIRQVLDNLIVNAMRYTPAGGSVHISATMEKNGMTCSISDTGAGLQPEDAAHIFERFVKSKDSGGSGLGLAIAKGIVDAHGGTIAATSIVGSGTSVSFTLPVR